MRRRLRGVLQQLQFPSTFDLDAFCQGLRHTHGLVVTLVPVRTRPEQGACGWLAHQPDHDRVFVLYESRTSPLHRTLIALHEISHRLLSHTGTRLAAEGFLDLVAPDLDPAVARRVLGRNSYTDTQEVEAETLATMLVVALGRAGRTDPATAGSPETVRRLAATLEDVDPHRGW